MSYSPIGNHKFDIAAALDSAVHGTTLKGFAAEYNEEMQHRHGGGNVRIPLQALVAAKATGANNANPLYNQAVPLNGFQMDATLTDIGAAIRPELAALRAGVRMVSTAEAIYKMPRAIARPTASVYDVDAPIADAGDSGFDTVDIEPVVIAGITTIANSLSFARQPDAVSVVTNHLTNGIMDAIDAAIFSGYATAGGRAWAGLIGSATPSGVALNNASTAAQWRAVVEAQMLAMQTTSPQNLKWLVNPRVLSLLMISPIFAGSTNALAMTTGATPLFGFEMLEALKVPAAATTEVLFGDFAATTCVAFDSASISLIANPFEADAFSKGATKLRAIASIGVAQTDVTRVSKSTVTL